MTRYIHLQIVGTLPRQLTSSSASNRGVQCVDHRVPLHSGTSFLPLRAAGRSGCCSSAVLPVCGGGVEEYDIACDICDKR